MQKGYTLSERSESKGFTPILIVILVVVLGIGGYFVYTNYSNLSQVKSRDNRTTNVGQIIQTSTPTPTPTPDPALQRDLDRQRDILYLWKAMEVNKDMNSSTYTALSAKQFASGKIPIDPIPGNVYCAISPASTITLATWTKSCPTGWSQIREGSLGEVKSWTICAWLEKNGAQYCKSNY